MVKRIARGGFKDLRDNDLLELSATVLRAMAGNTNFPNPDPDLDEVQAAHDLYSERLHVAKRGSQLESSLKNDARKHLSALLKRLAFYVSTVADGSLSIVLSSGFQPNRPPTPTGIPGKPERVRLVSWLQSGQANLMFDSVKDAIFYEYQYTSESDEQGNPVWADTLFNTPRGNMNILAPLTPGVKYFARVRARNKVGTSDWTTPETIYAQ